MIPAHKSRVGSYGVQSRTNLKGKIQMNYKSNLAVKEEESYKVHAATAVGTVLTLVVDNAAAAVPADVTTAITGAATDVATVGAAVIVVMVGIKVWKWIQRAL